MGKIWNAIKETMDQAKISMQVADEIEPSAFKVSDQLIRENNETYYDWSKRVLSKLNEVLGPPEKIDKCSHTYYEKRNYVVYLWYTLYKVFDQQESGVNYYKKVHRNCRELSCCELNFALSLFSGVRFHKLYLEPLKLMSNPEKVRALIGEYYRAGYIMLDKYVRTKSFSGNDEMLLKMLN